ncbi:MAG: ASCH domain-containing protein [Ruminococcaceae bacterium]|nr:ASCH domain-containing protein [Oscillospiraceae bacterium]
MTHQMNLAHEPFEKIKSGTKTIEMRLFDEKRAAIRPGDIIVFTDLETKQALSCAVRQLYRYPDFAELYRYHDPVSIGYNANETPHPDDMLSYYTKEQIAKYGVVGIEIQHL